MNEIMSFEDAIIDSQKYSKRHLILGNGFSIGCFPEIFNYPSLFNQINFDQILQLREAFRVLGTYDFEVVIKALENSRNILPIYMRDPIIIKEIDSHINRLKEVLIQTISKNHPALPSEITENQYQKCQVFLNYFLSGSEKSGHIYTLNYDLLLYWVLMHNNLIISKNDGFGNIEDELDASHVVWQGLTNSVGMQRIHFLHGAMHLFDAGYELKKYSWRRKGISLIEQIRQSIAKNEFPLFVSEGTYQQKMNKIKHHDYLSHSYRSLMANCKTKSCFFIYGHSLADNDEHILKRLGKGCFPKLYVSIYDDHNSENNRLIMNRANKLCLLRNNKCPLTVSFYDAKSANVWG